MNRDLQSPVPPGLRYHCDSNGVNCKNPYSNSGEFNLQPLCVLLREVQLTIRRNTYNSRALTCAYVQLIADSQAGTYVSQLPKLKLAKLHYTRLHTLAGLSLHRAITRVFSRDSFERFGMYSPISTPVAHFIGGSISDNYEPPDQRGRDSKKGWQR